MNKAIRRMGVFTLLAAAGLALAGCASSSTVPGKLVSVTSAGFGIDVTATSADTGTPAVKMGFFRNTVIVEPVSTNKLSAPDFANTFALDQNAKPFTFGVNETAASGSYQTAQPGATNIGSVITSQPIAPK